MAESKNPLLNSSIFLAVVTAVLYCMRAAYNGGFLGILHLDANILDQNFHQILYDGFLNSLVFVLFALLAYPVICFFYSHMLLPEFNDWLRKNSHRKLQFLNLKDRWESKRRVSPYELRAKQHTVAVLRYMGVCVVFILSMLYSEAQGRKAAFEFLKKTKPPVQDADLISVKIDGGQPLKLVSLACGIRNCAGIDPATKMIYYFPQNGLSFQYSQPVQQPSPASSKER